MCTRQNSNNNDSFVCWTVERGVGYLLVDVLRVCDLSIRFRTFPSLRVGRIGRVDRVALLVFRRDGYGETSVRSNARMLFTRDDYADQQRNLCSDVYIFFSSCRYKYKNVHRKLSVCTRCAFVMKIIDPRILFFFLFLIITFLGFLIRYYPFVNV